MTGQILVGDCLDRIRELPDGSVHTCVTSPPYFGLRDYGHDGQIGLEQTPDEYVAKMVAVFRDVRRVLRDDGTLWLNLGDSYFSTTRGSGGSNPETSPLQAWKGSENGQGFPARKISSGSTGLKPKDLMGIPWRVAFALQADGWYLRQDLIWHKQNPMPESVRDRCTKAHEYIFLMSKSERYYFDADAIAERAANPGDLGILRGVTGVGQSDCVSWHAPSIAKRQSAGVDSRTAGKETRNRRSVWTVATHPFSEAHFATYPVALIEPCVLAGAPLGGVVLDPFFGAGTTGIAAVKHGRRYVGIEINPEYAEMAARRLDEAQRQGDLFHAADRADPVEQPRLFGVPR